MPVLFSEPYQPRTRPLGYVEPAVHWFIESTWPEAVSARATVSAWYKAFPDPHGHLRTRLLSENDTTHYQALDELYVHQLLRQRCEDVRYEEGDGPDFRVYVDGVCVAGIEVRSMFQRQDWSDELLRHGRLADALNASMRPTAGYFVNFQVEHAECDPDAEPFIAFIRKRLAELPPHEQTYAAGGQVAPFVYGQSGVRITGWFSPMKPDAPSKTNPDARISGIGQMIGGFSNSAIRLKRVLNEKARKEWGRYNLSGVPFLIAIGVHDMDFTDDVLLDALHGNESVDIQTHEVFRESNGFFGSSADYPAGRWRRVSAVALLRGLPLWDSADTSVAVFDNPFALEPWPYDVIPVDRHHGVIERTETSMRLDWLTHGT